MAAEAFVRGLAGGTVRTSVDDLLCAVLRVEIDDFKNPPAPRLPPNQIIDFPSRAGCLILFPRVRRVYCNHPPAALKVDIPRMIIPQRASHY